MATFISVCSNQVLCIKPARVQVLDGVTLPVEGAHIRFDAGKFTTDDEAKAEFIRKHPLFGSRIFEEEPEKKLRKSVDKEPDKTLA